MGEEKGSLFKIVMGLKKKYRFGGDNKNKNVRVHRMIMKDMIFLNFYCVLMIHTVYTTALINQKKEKTCERTISYKIKSIPRYSTSYKQ